MRRMSSRHPLQIYEWVISSPLSEYPWTRGDFLGQRKADFLQRITADRSQSGVAVCFYILSGVSVRKNRPRRDWAAAAGVVCWFPGYDCGYGWHSDSNHVLMRGSGRPKKAKQYDLGSFRVYSLQYHTEYRCWISSILLRTGHCKSLDWKSGYFERNSAACFFSAR